MQLRFSAQLARSANMVSSPYFGSLYSIAVVLRIGSIRKERRASLPYSAGSISKSSAISGSISFRGGGKSGSRSGNVAGSKNGGLMSCA